MKLFHNFLQTFNLGMIFNRFTRRSPEPDILQMGHSGTAVESLQAELAELQLYGGAIDGIFGAKTQKAVKVLQRYFGIAATGKLDNQTWYALSFQAHELLAQAMAVELAVEEAHIPAFLYQVA